MVLVVVAAGAAGCGGDSTGGGGADGSGGPGGSFPELGEPHTPATGCHAGYAACGEVCAHLEDDSRHCGGCDNACPAGSCVDGQCQDDGLCVFQPVCGGVCVAASWNPDHCGSCMNSCADDAVCVEGVCVDGGGDGTSCQSPLFWNLEAEEDAGFRMTPGVTVEHTFECGPLEPLPTRWFRFTATDDDSRVKVRTEGPDDYIVEVYGDESCSQDDLLGCNDDETGGDPEPELDLVSVPGQTYWVAVGIKGTWSGSPANLRLDH